MGLFNEIWQLLSGRQRRQFVWLQLASVVSSVATLSGIAAVVPFFSVLADPALIGNNRILTGLYISLGFNSERTYVISLGLAFVALVAISNLVNLAGTVAITRFAYSVYNDFQVTLYREYLRRDYLFHSATSAATLQSRIVNETARATVGLLQSVLSLISNCALTLVVVISVAFVNSIAALGVLAALAGIYAGVYFIARHRLGVSGRAQSALNSRRTALIADSFGAIKELKLLDDQAFLAGRLVQYCRSISAATVTSLAVAQSPRPLLEFLTAAGLVGAALALAPGAAGKPTWLAQFTFLGLAVYRLLPALQQSFAAIVRISVDRSGLRQIACDLRCSRQFQPIHRAATAGESWHGRPRSAIRLERVSFRYSADRPLVIDKASCELPARSLIGIVGANGSGKTTLVDLILGLLRPESGTVTIDGIVLDASSQSAWQSTVAYVPQSVFLLDASLAENIALGVAPAEINQRRLVEAVRLAGLDALVATWPNGLAQRIGGGGQRLSGGEQQRVGLARALYRDASLLVLDESTSGMDARGESEVMQLLGRLRIERTVILVTHRVQSLKHFDIIYALSKGKIVNSGNGGGKWTSVMP
jgi:ATP-binding cassette, subfamily B, bacterial PglK